MWCHDVVDIYPWMGQAGKQSKASKALHETNALSRDHAWHQDIFPEISSTGTHLSVFWVLYIPSVLEIPLPWCISPGLFYICQFIILPARSPRSAPLLVPPVIYARLIGFVPVSSPLSIVLSRISDALLHIWKLVTPHITQLRLWYLCHIHPW